ncbi:MAG: hypothetical protein NVSMB2_12420 [Chloroflexota bacterium]
MLTPSDPPAHASSDVTFGRVKLLGVIAVLALAGTLLAFVAGPPQFPTQTGEPVDMGRLLGGSHLPWQFVLAILVDATWLIWIWAIASLVLDVLIVVAELVAGGAAWVHWARATLDRCTLPLVRRAVAGACAVELFAHSLSVVHAAPLPSVESHTSLNATVSSNRTVGGNARTAEAAALPERIYAVQSGDTLWSIAAREYGAGAAFRRIVDANVGRQMPTGARFTARGVIQPGWLLVLPDAPPVVELVDGHQWYTVQPGDTLSSIATVTLGDAKEWKNIFDLNRGALATNGHTLDDADVIWPGLKLRLPDATDGSADPAASSPTDDDAGTAADDFTAARSASSTGLSAADTTEIIVDGLETEPSSTIGPESASASDDPLIRDEWAPLLRTAHAADPIALAPLDAVGTETPADVTPSDNEGGVPSAPWNDGLPLVPLASGAAAGIAAVGGLVIAHRRRKFRRLHTAPETEVVVEDGFATADLASGAGERHHGALEDPLTATVRRVMAFLEEYTLSDTVACVSVTHGRSGTTLALSASLASQPLVLDLIPALAVDLGREIEASFSGDGDLLVRISHVGKMPPLAPARTNQQHLPVLVPVGVLYDRRVVAAAWPTFGHALVTSLPGQGADTILTSVIAAVAARHAPTDLRLWCIGKSRAHTAPIFTLPHVERRLDVDDAASVALALEELRLIVDRADNAPGKVLIVLPELADVHDLCAELSLIIPPQPSACVRILAATSMPDRAVDNALSDHLTTRFVLRTADEETSVALLGVADAAYLGGGGRMLMRLDNRAPVELYGYQVTSEHLGRLVRVKRSNFTEHKRPTVAVSESRFRLPQSEAADALRRADDPQPAPTPEREERNGSSTSVPVLAPPGTTLVEDATPLRPTLDVTCFGGPRVMCAAHQVWPNPEVGEAKPWELLLFVATRPPEGVSTADAIDALWPDDVCDNASQRFRQLRYRLRLALSSVPGAPARDGVVLSRGILRLDRDVVYSDASEFLDLIARSRNSVGSDSAALLERARTLYVGDLLDGPEARRYGWVDERDGTGVTLREHFRKLYTTASSRLAEMYANTADGYAAACDLYRELTELDPVDERLWRALFRLHAERGDRPALVREERRLRELLREFAAEGDATSLDGLDEPSRELSVEYQRLLDGTRSAGPRVVSV